jgi:hypothetical protein
MIISRAALSQSRMDSILTRVDNLKFASSVSKRAVKLEQELEKKTGTVLNKMQRSEEKLYRKMLKGKDSLLARTKLDEIRLKYDLIKNHSLVEKATHYIPELDSLTTSLKFLDANGASLKIKEALINSTGLQNQFNYSEQVRKFIKERKEQLKQVLEKTGFVKQLKKINKTVYYYSAQLKEYKEILKDPKKIQKKALELLSKTKVWQEFMRKNSLFASLFPGSGMPINSNSPQNGFAGLQTRVQLGANISRQYAGMTATAIPFTPSLSQNIEKASMIINQLRTRFGAINASEDFDMPDFKPNNQKVKSFKKRLQIGTDLQNQKSNAFFVSTSDIALSIGYKLNDQSILGVASSVKIGWGKDIQHLKISGQGFSLRTFGDVKIKNSFYASGGFELNFQESFRDIRSLYEIDPWKKSALIGLTKIIAVKTKLFKNTKVQLLYDFLHKESLPITQALKIRVGYIF